MKLKILGRLLFKRSFYHFSEEQKPNGFTNFLKSAWRQTFPQEEDIVRQRYQKVKEEKRYTQE